MVKSYPNPDQIRNQLTKKYQKLSPKEKQMVQLFSVIYEPVTRTGLMQCLGDAGIKDENEKSFISKTLKPYIDRLIKYGKPLS